MEWFQNNLGNIIVSIILIIITAAVLYKMISDRKKGKSSCGCGCDNCQSKCKKPKN